MSLDNDAEDNSNSKLPSEGVKRLKYYAGSKEDHRNTTNSAASNNEPTSLNIDIRGRQTVIPTPTPWTFSQAIKK